MSSGQPNRTPLDIKKVEDAFRANLRQQIRQDEENYKANMTYLRTGQLPVAALPDTRSVTEKLLDVERLKTELQKKLLTITDGFEANKIVQNLAPDQLTFLAQNFPPIQDAMKKLYSVGVLADIFIDYLNRYIDKFNQNRGLDNNLQQQAGITEILLNSRTILDQMANVNDVNKIIQKIRSTGARNDMVFLELAALRDFIEVLPNIVDDINKTNNAIIQNQLDILLNMVANDLPTNEQLEQVNRKLDVAIRARDNLALGQILDDLQGLLMSSDDIKLQMNILQQAVAQTNETTSNILAQMATKDDFTEIIRQLQQIKIQQIKTSPETKRIIKELTDMRKMVDILPTIIDDLNKTTTAPINAKLNEIMNRIRLDMPTNVELDEIKNKLDIGLQTQNNTVLTDVLEQLAQLVASNNDIKGHVGVLQDNITQLKRDLRTGQEPPSQPQREPEREPVPTNIRGPPARLRGEPSNLGSYPSGYPFGRKNQTPPNLGNEDETPSGRGMKGKGITPRKYTSQVLPTDVDYNKGIKATAKFVPMGRHLININQLDKDIIAIKRKKGSVINTLPSQRVTRKLGGVIRKIIGGSLPTFDELNDLDDEEKLYLSKVASETQIGGKLSIPTPKKTSEEQDINQFEILRGQILAGNDSNEVVKQFKSIILKLANKNLIPKGQVREILLDLTTLGH